MSKYPKRSFWMRYPLHYYPLITIGGAYLLAALIFLATIVEVYP